MYVSDIIDIGNIRANTFNLIEAGCGSGKNEYVANKLLQDFPNVKGNEVLYLTSRTLIVDQQSKRDNIRKYHSSDLDLVRYWNGEIPESGIDENLINIMTYKAVIDILNYNNSIDHETLERIKIIICDECHCLFSDTFIKDINLLRFWLKTRIYSNNTTVIGMTATANIIHYYNLNWGIRLNKLNDKPLINHKAKNLICTDFDSLTTIIKNKTIKGKTMIMCQSIRQCRKLESEIENSFTLVSKYNPEFNEEMKKVRDYIVQNSNLPNTANNKPLEVLLTTSTMREGVNLNKECEIKNIICCYGDEVNIIQFLGRCRYDVENLVVVDIQSYNGCLTECKYLESQRKSFQNFFDHEGTVNNEWFELIRDIVTCSLEDVQFMRKLTASSKLQAILEFLKYINKRWLSVKDGKRKKDTVIYLEEQKDEIVKRADELDFIDTKGKPLTFNKVINYLENNGYEIESVTIRKNNKRYRAKFIYLKESNNEK